MIPLPHTKPAGPPRPGPANLFRLLCSLAISPCLAAFPLVQAGEPSKAETPAPPPATSNSTAAESAPLAARAIGILREQCLACHDARKHKGDLRMTSRDELLRGGSEGPAVVPGKSAESRLIAVLHPEAELHMPPKIQLEEAAILTLREWIDAGLPWDDAAPAPAPPPPVEFANLPAGYHPVFALALAPDQARLAAGRGNRLAIFDLAAPAPADAAASDPATPGATASASTPAPAPAEASAAAAAPPAPAPPLEFASHEDAVRSLAWSPDGKRLASGSHGRIVLHDTATWAESRLTTRGLEERVTALAFSPDSAHLYSADGAVPGKGWIKVWKVEDGSLAQSWEAHEDSIFALAADPKGATLYSAGVDGLVKLWDVAAMKLSRKYEGHTGHVLALALAPDGKRLASGGADHTIKIWDVETAEQKFTIAGHPSAVTGLLWAGDPPKLLSACEDGAPRRATGESESLEKTFAKSPEVLYALAATPDGKRVYAGAHDGRVYVWNEEGKAPVALEPGGPAK